MSRVGFGWRRTRSNSGGAPGQAGISRGTTPGRRSEPLTSISAACSRATRSSPTSSDPIAGGRPSRDGSPHTDCERADRESTDRERAQCESTDRNRRRRRSDPREVAGGQMSLCELHDATQRRHRLRLEAAGKTPALSASFPDPLPASRGEGVREETQPCVGFGVAGAAAGAAAAGFGAGATAGFAATGFAAAGLAAGSGLPERAACPRASCTRSGKRVGGCGARPGRR